MISTQQPDSEAGIGLTSEPAPTNSTHTIATTVETQEQIALRAGALLSQGYH